MILLILVGIYAVLAKRIRVTHSFELTGDRARNFGLTLIIGALPATAVLNLVIRPFLPKVILSDRLFVSFANVGFLAVLMFGTAWYFRDRQQDVSAAPDFTELPPGQQSADSVNPPVAPADK